LQGMMQSRREGGYEHSGKYQVSPGKVPPRNLHVENGSGGFGWDGRAKIEEKPTVMFGDMKVSEQEFEF